MREIIFTKDFATKKKGDKFSCDSILANQLVKIDKVAKYDNDEHQEELEKLAKEEEKRAKADQKEIDDKAKALKKLQEKRFKENAARRRKNKK